MLSSHSIMTAFTCIETTVGHRQLKQFSSLFRVSGYVRVQITIGECQELDSSSPKVRPTLTSNIPARRDWSHGLATSGLHLRTSASHYHATDLDTNLALPLSQNL